MRNEKELKLKLKKSNEKLKKLRKDNLDLKKKNLHLIQGRSIELKEIERLQESNESLKSEVMKKDQIISEITGEIRYIRACRELQKPLILLGLILLSIYSICYIWSQL